MMTRCRAFETSRNIYTRHPLNPFLSIASSKSRPIKTNLLILFSSGAQVLPGHPFKIVCTPWKNTRKRRINICEMVTRKELKKEQELSQVPAIHNAHQTRWLIGFPCIYTSLLLSLQLVFQANHQARVTNRTKILSFFFDKYSQLLKVCTIKNLSSAKLARLNFRCQNLVFDLLCMQQ